MKHFNERNTRNYQSAKMYNAVLQYQRFVNESKIEIFKNGLTEKP